ncbi:hypothetical protein MLD38_033331 [Melastoma candidum]|uniref:Uncharacterized protein n=1 Tax=Melastoma candidum TaxID=119954 RepID=A0ACB9MA44_9MYRT|nr:hypothetical protein MLD38_033331 [Melastoma candidum]
MEVGSASAVSDGGNDGVNGGSVPELDNKKPVEGEIKSKRKMKTASQLETLEKTYAVEQYPSEAIRGELSVLLGLSDRQLQMWFCHRRLKDRKGSSSKRVRQDSPVIAASMEASLGADVPIEHGPGSVVGQISVSHQAMESWHETRPIVSTVAGIPGDYPVTRRNYEPEQSISERRVIAFVEAQLGESIRNDGPILGMEFDPLPPDAFGRPIGGGAFAHATQLGRGFETKYETRDIARPVHEYQFLPEKPTVRAEGHERAASSYHYGSASENMNAGISSLSSGHQLFDVTDMTSGYGHQSQIPTLSLLPPASSKSQNLASAAEDYHIDPQKNSTLTLEIDNRLGVHPIDTMEDTLLPSDIRFVHKEEILRVEKKRKCEEARMAREVEAHEKRIRKELKKQDALRRKQEEQMRKEMERYNRERQREEERLLRERQREVERYEREQRREQEKREKFLLKQSIRAEKMRAKEELRKEREAARLKAASQRAIARKIVKESVELIEDEKLELMELAASSNGLSSIVHLDIDTLQNLESFRESLVAFPPQSVQLKKPFAIQPWCPSEENIGNLLMAWRFLIGFADVLNLWPFTLDEFVQALHDYDSRLLGEIHVSLLRSIIKDIENVGRVPAATVGASGNSVANPGCGHLHIVEGAYAWGFDIRSWHCNLNQPTWPEILRQLALSAGFGPKIKKRNTDQPYLPDDNDEVDDGRHVISTLRNGVAAENAFAKMQERGLSSLRRSRHRLTPGTVKFAAFHVLSLEGDEGLSILEVADRIQKYGLRDLTTSKTPEASVAAALSRDTKLFERTAPSTYCVRPAYRKDPTDAEALLSTAKERIREFKNGVVEGEEGDDAERDDDSESDSLENPDVNDLITELNSSKKASREETGEQSSKSPANGNIKDEKMKLEQNGVERGNAYFASTHSEALPHSPSTRAVDQSTDHFSNLDKVYGLQDTDLKERDLGETWVLGLMEGEYANLSVQERLDALISLIDIAMEGSSIHNVLEERLEAASALKKQMWAEGQIDKRRMKEDFVTRVHYSPNLVNKTETNLCCLPAEGQSPMPVIDDGNNRMPVGSVVQQELTTDQRKCSPSLSSFPVDSNLQPQHFTVNGTENLPLLQAGFAIEMSRSCLKAYISYKAEQMYVYRSLPLGQDRRRNRYWQFVTSASCNDPGSGRIFVELQDGRWRLIDSEEGFDSLVAALDVRGSRESFLYCMLLKIEGSFKETLRKYPPTDVCKRHATEVVAGPESGMSTASPSSFLDAADSEESEVSTSFRIEVGRNPHEKINALRRYQDFEDWMLKECLNSSKLMAIDHQNKRCKQFLNVCDWCHNINFTDIDRCLLCGNPVLLETSAQGKGMLQSTNHSTLEGADCSPVRMKVLKMQLSLIEASIPPKALGTIWTDEYRRYWGVKLYSASSPEQLLQALTLLESAIQRDYLSLTFETTNELLRIPTHPSSSHDILANFEDVPILPWIPKTTAGVALRVLQLDSAIVYSLNQELDDVADNRSVEMSSKCAVEQNTPSQVGNGGGQEENWVDPGGVLNKSGRGGRGGRGRGISGPRSVRPQRKRTSSRFGSSREVPVVTNGEKSRQARARGRPRTRSGRRRGQCSGRNRQKAMKKTAADSKARYLEEEEMAEASRVQGEDNLTGDGENRELPFEEDENDSSSEGSDFEDEVGRTARYGYRVAGEDDADDLSRKSDDLFGGSRYKEDDEYEDDDNDDNGEEDDEDDDAYVNLYTNEESDADDLRDDDGVGFRKLDPDEGLGSTSSESSD